MSLSSDRPTSVQVEYDLPWLSLDGIVVFTQVKTSRGSYEQWATFRIENEGGEISVLAFPGVYGKLAKKIEIGDHLTVTGTLDYRDPDEVRFVATAITKQI